MRRNSEQQGAIQVAFFELGYEQHAETVLTLTQDAVVMERGAIVHRAPSRALLDDAATLDRLIGLKIDSQSSS